MKSVFDFDFSPICSSEKDDEKIIRESLLYEPFQNYKGSVEKSWLWNQSQQTALRLLQLLHFNLSFSTGKREEAREEKKSHIKERFENEDREHAKIKII